MLRFLLIFFNICVTLKLLKLPQNPLRSAMPKGGTEAAQNLTSQESIYRQCLDNAASRDGPSVSRWPGISSVVMRSVIKNWVSQKHRY